MSTMPPPRTQRAQILRAFNEPYSFTAAQAVPASPTGHQLLIRVRAASYCHTDAVFAAGQMMQDLPRVGSHEFAGVVEAMGPKAEGMKGELGIEEGMLVGIPGRAFGPCGGCVECKGGKWDGDWEGYGVWCPSAGNLGLSVDGGFQEWCVADARQVAPVPRGEGGRVKMEAVEVAPLMCAGVTIWSAVERAGLDLVDKGKNEGRSVAILGAGGGLGHLGVQFASKLGCEVLACDVGGALEMCKEVKEELGEEGKRVTVVDARADVAVAKEMVFGRAEAGFEGEKGCDAAIILPEAQAAFDFGMGILKNHATCVVVSFPKDGWKFQPRDLVFRHINMVGVLVGRNRHLRAMLKFAADNNVRAKLRTYALEDLNRLVEDYHKGAGGKLVVDMEKKPQ